MLLTLALLSVYTVIGQSNQNEIQATPTAVLEEIFRAANEEDYSNLHLLCPPNGSNDGDTQEFICDIAAGGDDQKTEFISYFKDAKITGKPRIVTAVSGDTMAEVPFWFNHPGGESRSNETMHLILKDGKWYLSHF